MIQARADSGRAAAREDYYARVEAANLAPLWTFFEDWFGPVPRMAAVPSLWSYGALRPLILEAARQISTEEAERRVLAVENPGLKGRHLATESLYAGLQLIMPGEIARSHRHTAAALRFVIEGSGAYTSVEGERCHMKPGDLIVTPGWSWHDHGHEGSGPTVWMDVLDVPLNQMLGTLFSESYPSKRFPERAPPDDSLYRYGMNMMPAGGPHKRSPIFSYPYARAREVLERLKRQSEWDPHHGLKMEYIDPTRGESVIPTISTFLQLVPRDFETARYRSTDAAVFCVVEGRGHIAIGGSAERRGFDYEPHDIIAIPSWVEYSIAAHEESVLFSASDRVVQRKLCLWREHRG